MVWKEETSSGIRLVHVFRPMVSDQGDICNDNPKHMLGEKCSVLLLIRPIHTLAKTFFHLCLPLSLTVAILRAKKGDELKACVQTLADIVRTPVYGIALWVCAAVGLVLGIADSDHLFTLRLLAGRIEQHLNWGEPKNAFWTLAPCFQPASHEDEFIATWGQRRYSDTIYDHLTPRQCAEANLARAAFTSRRKKPILFYCFSTWRKDSPLDSHKFDRFRSPCRDIDRLLPVI
ncbi:MAG: hypothetical protein S4CHLAM102_02730 [Chlamydiia bacterium]|nr:hypothetical protein [Chlamydiia bacterium]